MMSWSSLYESLVMEANLSPSVHNVQPTLWKLNAECIELFVNEACLVPAADPENRDIEISLGTAIEGLSIASLRHGFEIEVDYLGLNNKPVARITAKPTESKPDPLSAFVFSRQSYRGIFTKATEQQEKILIDTFQDHQCARVLTGKDMIQQSSDLYEQATLAFYREPGFLEELNDWLRFSKKHDRYEADGLNRDSMALDPITSWAASIVMKPNIYKKLDKIGLAAPLITEAPQIKSSTGILFFIRNTENSHYVTGRKLYRMWLEVERAGFAVCPLSSLTDDEKSRKEISKYLVLESHQEAALAFRCGPKPIKNFKRARKPFKETQVNL